jgi:hypothetical protein
VLLRVLISLAVVLVLLVVAAQFALPPLAENEIEDRLTKHGGTAEADVEAFPGARLLFSDGDRIEVRGSALDLRLEERTDVFENLDGFGEVDVRLRDFRAGPLDIERFTLVRDGGGPYELDSAATTTPGNLLDFGASRVGLPGGPLVQFFSDAALGTEPIDLGLDMELESEDGDISVVSGGGTINGVPTGPLGEVLAATIVAQL